NNEIAPAFVGVTAELAGPFGASAPSAALTPSPSEGERVPDLSSIALAKEEGRVREQSQALLAAEGSGKGQGVRISTSTKVLIVGGGSSHDFDRWFNQEDTKTLSAKGQATVAYTDKPDEILPALKDLQVLYLSNNQPLKDPALRKAIFDFAEAGKGLLLVHPALWYNWADWPEYNRVLVGGGARSHDKYGEFEVHVNVPLHPVMAGVPDSFKINDELYHFEPDKDGAPVQV